MKNSLKPALAVLSAILILATSNSCLAADQMLAAVTGGELSAPSQTTDQPIIKQLLTPVGYDTAQQLGLLTLIEQIRALRFEQSKSLESEVKRLQLKQTLTDNVFTATLQVRDVTARIDREVARLSRLKGYLEDKRDRALKLNTMSNAFGMGVIGEVGQAGEMKVNEIPGEITELVGGGLTMALSAMSLYLQKGETRRVPTKPNMLSKVFKYPVNKETDYPTVVWNYLNRVPANEPTHQTRLQSLFQHWRKYEIIGNDRNSKEVRRTALLSNSHARSVTNIDLIDDQIALLTDLKIEIYQLDRDLLELFLSTQAL